MIPPFLGRRKSLTLREEALTKVISKARIHIERWNHRMKQFLFVKGPVPSVKKNLLSQAVYVCAMLANFSQVLAK